MMAPSAASHAAPFPPPLPSPVAETGGAPSGVTKTVTVAVARVALEGGPVPVKVGSTVGLAGSRTAAFHTVMPASVTTASTIAATAARHPRRAEGHAAGEREAGSDGSERGADFDIGGTFHGIGSGGAKGAGAAGCRSASGDGRGVGGFGGDEGVGGLGGAEGFGGDEGVAGVGGDVSRCLFARRNATQARVRPSKPTSEAISPEIAADAMA
jgi:hypothetical protein